MITLDSVSKSYAKGQPAVNNVSLHIEKGEFVFIVGNSGSGKSTLIKLLLKELEPTSGTIKVNGQILNKMKVDASELEGLAGIPLQVEGVEVGVTIKQKDENSYKISMRSANNANVSDICASMGGGGHVKAAGCLLHGTLDEVKKQIVDAVAKGIKSC